MSESSLLGLDLEYNIKIFTTYFRRLTDSSQEEAHDLFCFF